MEDGIHPERKKQSQSFPWFEEIDQILVVGMRHGPRGTQEAVKRVRQLTPELAPGVNLRLKFFGRATEGEAEKRRKQSKP
jgi:hypothetical protein